MAKSKFRTIYCDNCRAEKKMQILSAVEGAENKVWHKCSRCRHSFLFDTLIFEQKENESKELNRETCADYNPTKSYKVGSSIYHTDWDDMGFITGKEKLSSGLQSIVVDFQKNGSKRLIENLQED